MVDFVFFFDNNTIYWFHDRFLLIKIMTNQVTNDKQWFEFQIIKISHRSSCCHVCQIHRFHLHIDDCSAGSLSPWFRQINARRYKIICPVQKWAKPRTDMDKMSVPFLRNLSGGFQTTNASHQDSISRER